MIQRGTSRVLSRCSIVVGLALSAALLYAAPAHAQQPPCGDTSFARDALDRDWALFTLPGDAVVRGDVIQHLSPSDVHEVVTDSLECRRILHAARHHLPPPRTWGTHWVYRFGPYVAVEIMPKVPPGIIMEGGDALYIFREADMRYVIVRIGV